MLPEFEPAKNYSEQDEEVEPTYQSILELDKRLSKADIPHDLSRLLGGYQITYPSEGEREGDVICHMFSYGHENDLMEADGFDLPGVCGWLTVDEAFDLIKNYDAKRSTT